MKKITFLLIAVLTAIAASAEPANPTPITMKQSNGETVQIKLVGDEFYHFNTTIDGYTVINTNGNWEYAVKKGNSMVPSGLIAHDPAARSTQEQQLLAGVEKYLVDIPATAKGEKARKMRDKKNQGQKAPVVDYNTFRGLIILINYNDRQFQMSDANNFYNELCNTPNYSGFYHQGRFQSCTGSVRDYYYDNSMGQFDPEFDVVGPVNLDFSCLEGNDKSRQIFQAALNAVDDQVDFSQYDADNDGMIDMVFFMVAGYSSSYSGNNEGYLWPHMSYLYGYSPENGWYWLQYDGKYMGRYASSCEIYGWESYGHTMPNAIGTICHEFGHVLGLPDLYDTDYGGSGGESNHPGGWDVMAGGSSSNYGRTPVGYSLWERVELGFAETPPELTLGTKTLAPINTSNTGYRMQSPNANEYFLFENRQPNKWDAALPGHGLVIARVDYSNMNAWDSNDVNSNPAHNYYELVRAAGASEAGVPFPGNSNVTEINSITDPALVTWAGEPCQYGLAQIIEQNQTVTFNVTNDVTPKMLVETFDQIQTGLPDNATEVLGDIATWNFPKANVVDNNGGHAAALEMPGGIAMNSDVDIDIYKISLNAVNNSSSVSKLQLYYSTDEGESWNSLGVETAAANATTTISWRIDLDKQPMRFKINRTSGSKNVPLIIDDLAIHYSDSTVYDLWIAGTQVNGTLIGNLSQIDGVEGLVQYLPISNTLTLKDASITTSSSTTPNQPQAIINDMAGLHIELLGNNSIFTQRNVYALYFKECDGVVIDGGGTLAMESAVNDLGIGYFTHKTGEVAHTTISNCSITMPSGIIQNEDNDCALTIDRAHIYIGYGYLSTPPELRLTGCQIIKPAGGYIDDYGTLVSPASLSMYWGEIEIVPSTVIVGDVNGDGNVTSADITAIYSLLLNNDSSSIVNGDVDGDGNITSSDVTAIYNILLNN